MARCIVISLLAALLSSCVSQSTIDSSLSERSFPGLEASTSWQLRGKMGVRSGGGNANLGFVWNESPEHFDITLKGLMGVAVADISGDRQLVTLKLPDGRQHQNVLVESLLAEQLGYDLPVSMLRHWVRGIPDPSYSAQQLSHGFTQQGWSIIYQQYGVAGPRKILIERADIRVKLVALEWAY